MTNIQRATQRWTADFPIEMMGVRTQWIDIFKVLKESNCPFIILNQQKYTLKIKVKEVSSANEGEFATRKPVLKNILKGVLQI